MPHDLPVRRCRSCNQAAVLPGMVTEHRSLTVDSVMATQSYRCQACGRGFTQLSWPLMLALVISGVVLIPLFVGLPLLLVAVWLHLQNRWHPVVPGAPMPPLRYRTAPKPRTCTECGGACPAYRVRQHYVQSLPSGRDVSYHCPTCGTAFTIHSLGGLLLYAVGGLLAVSGGWFFGLAGGVFLLPLAAGALCALAGCMSRKRMAAA